MNFRISVKMLSKTKYLHLFLDENHFFKYYLDTIKLKLNRENCLLSKIKHYVRAPLLRTIYITFFDPHPRYRIWEQNKNYAVENIEKIQKKVIRILDFKGPREEASNLYQNQNNTHLNR